jgi:hypothetical protein
VTLIRIKANSIDECNMRHAHGADLGETTMNLTRWALREMENLFRQYSPATLMNGLILGTNEPMPRRPDDERKLEAEAMDESKCDSRPRRT